MVRIPTDGPPTHPGEMLFEEFLRPLGVTQRELATRLGVSYPRINELIHGKRAVTPDTALRLEQLLGMPAQFWLNLQLAWDLYRGEALKRVGPSCVSRRPTPGVPPPLRRLRSHQCVAVAEKPSEEWIGGDCIAQLADRLRGVL